MSESYPAWMTRGSRGRSGQGVDDAFWIDTRDKHYVNVMMTGAHAIAYQRWLRDNGLHLFRIPNDVLDGVEFAVGVRDSAMFLGDVDDPLRGDGHDG